MRRHATATSSGPNERKPSDRGGSPSGRLRLAVLLATVAAFLLVPAAQALATPSFKLNVNGTGKGEVTSVVEEPFEESSPPIACSYNGTSKSGICEDEVAELESPPNFYGIELLAVAAPGSEFVGWTIQKGAPGGEQCPYGPEPEYCLLISEKEGEDEFEARATFCPVGEPTCASFPLAIAKTGEGTITSKPGGIVCTGAKTGAECEHNFGKGETVTLTASPATGYAFGTWAGCTEHVGLTCKVTLSKATTVKVGFVATPSLTIKKAGSGQGKVGATGISCDENCSEATSAIKVGTSVTVKATPAKGSEAAVFEGGTGSASGCSGASCTFTISENSSVKVKFNPIPTKTLTVALSGPAKYKGKVTGKGTVKGLTSSAISCGSGCTSQTESFFTSDEVTLSAVAGTGYTFAGWFPSTSPGTCTGTTTPCTVKIDENKTLTAKFE